MMTAQILLFFYAAANPWAMVVISSEFTVPFTFFACAKKVTDLPAGREITADFDAVHFPR
jgi:hypothetical protein